MFKCLVATFGLMAFAATATGCADRQMSADRGAEEMRRASRPAELSARGEAFARIGDMTRAEQYFAAALKAGGDAAPLVRRLMAVCVADGRYPVALEYAEDYLRNRPTDVDVRYASGTVRAAIGDLAGARSALRSVIAAKPGLADPHYALAQIERGDGNVMGADAEFREYLRLAPDGPRAEVARANLMRAVPQ